MTDVSEFKQKVEHSPLLQHGIVAHVFSSERGGGHVYDTASGAIIKVGEVMEQVLEVLCAPSPEDRLLGLCALASEHSDDVVLEGLDGLERLQERGLFVHYRDDLELVTRPPGEEAPREARLHGLSLEVTQACNFRCGYCVFSGEHKGERTHSSRRMTWPTAKAAVDYFLAHAEPDEVGLAPYITFYGGEPLLERDLLRRCMEHARRVNPEVTFNVQTNGYCLDRETFRMLRRHDCTVSVSLDGSREVHDQWRTLPSGRGTFDRILSNLAVLAEMDPEYVRRRFVVTLSLADMGQLDETLRFFKEHPLLSQLVVSPHVVNHASDEQRARLMGMGASARAALERYMDGLCRGDLQGLSLEHEVFSGGLRTMARERFPVQRHKVPGGNCVLGEHRLFVSADGTFRACEKSSALPAMGDVQRGIDWGQVHKMEAEFLERCQRCKDCWCLQLCRLCYVRVYSEGGRIKDDQQMDQMCRRIRAGASNNLRLYAELLQRQPDLDLERLLGPRPALVEERLADRAA